MPTRVAFGAMTVLDGVGDEFLDDQHEPQRIVAACGVSRAEGFDKGGGFGHDGEPRGERRAEPDGAKRAPL